jgi:hypothetical protein
VACAHSMSTPACWCAALRQDRRRHGGRTARRKDGPAVAGAQPTTSAPGLHPPAVGCGNIAARLSVASLAAVASLCIGQVAKRKQARPARRHRRLCSRGGLIHGSICPAPVHDSLGSDSVGRTCSLPANPPTTSSPGLGSPLPHLPRDWAHPSHICPGTGPYRCVTCVRTR